MMAGSSLPVLWRRPAADIGPGERVDQMVAVSYHTLDAYGFHALEMAQCLVEQRAGGEPGIRAVQTRTGFETQEARPFMHFAYLLKGIEQMMLTGQPTWPVERTLLTSGALDFLLRSKLRGGGRIETPELTIPYRTNWRWESPPPPPPGRR